VTLRLGNRSLGWLDRDQEAATSCSSVAGEGGQVSVGLICASSCLSPEIDVAMAASASGCEAVPEVDRQ
jgi:hypothetical protein